jgi:hypothetical protein
MVKIGKVYQLYFGKDIYIKYKVVNIKSFEEVELEKIENYLGSDNIVSISIEKL